MNPTAELKTVVLDLRRLMGEAVRLLARLDEVPGLTGITPTQAKAAETAARVVALHWGVPEALLFSRDRHQPVAFARQVCMQLLREECRLSFSQIGTLFQRDHCTAIASVRAVANAVETNPSIGNKIDAARAEFRSQFVL